MTKIPSYKLYKKTGNWQVENLVNKNWISLEIKDEYDSSTRKQISKLKENLKDPSYSKIESDVFEFSCKNKLIIEKQEIEVSEKFHLLTMDRYIALQTVSSQAALMIEKKLSNKMELLLFSNQELIVIWKKLTKLSSEEDIRVSIHRLIVEGTSLESDIIKELNICAKDVSDLDLFNEIIKNSRKIKAITLKIKGIAKKPITIRLDKNRILIYGNHEKNHLLRVFSLMIKIRTI